jgi:thymidylate synthase ThyX
MSDFSLPAWVDMTRGNSMIRNDCLDSMILKDSLINNHRVTCFLVNFPRIVNAEVLRHRMGSFCSVSSRAVPGIRMKDQFCHYVPSRFSKHKPGMQPGEPEMEGSFFDEAEFLWKLAKEFNENIAARMNQIGVAKEQYNRLLEPFCYITLLIQMSGPGWGNFFTLRNHPDAQYEIRVLARMMQEQYEDNKPVNRVIHLPFIDSDTVSLPDIYKSVARAARTSYLKEGREPTLEEDMDLYDRLVVAWPPHLSPTEFPVFDFQWLIDQKILPENLERTYKGYSGNLQAPLVQFRKLLEPGNEDLYIELKDLKGSWSVFP